MRPSLGYTRFAKSASVKIGRQSATFTIGGGPIKSDRVDVVALPGDVATVGLMAKTMEERRKRTHSPIAVEMRCRTQTGTPLVREPARSRDALPVAPDPESFAEALSHHSRACWPQEPRLSHREPHVRSRVKSVGAKCRNPDTQTTRTRARPHSLAGERRHRVRTASVILPEMERDTRRRFSWTQRTTIDRFTVE